MSRRFSFSFAAVPVALTGFACTPTVGSADIIPSLAMVSMHGSHFTFTYSADLTSDETVKTNDFFTVYDFSGFVAGTNFQPAKWVFSSALLGKTPPDVNPHDNPHIPNLTWTYAGSRTLGPGPRNLG